MSILEILTHSVPHGAVEPVESADGMPTIDVAAAHLVETCRALRDTPDLRFAVLLDLVPIDLYPREPRFEMTYLLVSPGIAGFGETPQRLRVKVRVPGADPRLPTVSTVWQSANWAEREAYDLYGITFDGHPDLRRILMPEDWEGYPMRKDYPVQIKEPVKTYAPLQVTEEEFVANIENARAGKRQV
jgi:NADH-quinone oxidoreductase subunit C